MRRKRTGEPFAPTRDIPLPQLAQEGPEGRLQLWAARAANDPRRAPGGGTDSVRPHSSTPLAPAHQDADWDNDATTLFHRDVSLLAESKSAVQPIAAELRSSEPPAIEGGLTRSLWPRRASALRPLWYALPVLGVFIGIGLWSERGLSWKMSTPEWWVSAAKPPRAHLLTRGLPPVDPTPPPPAVEPPPPPPAPAAAVLVQAAVEEPAPAEPLARKSSRGHRSAHTPSARNGARPHRTNAAHIARRIQPLQDPPDDGSDEPSASEPSEGLLQVNSRPWARVIVDGSFVGNTPQRGLKLAAGRHHVQLVNDQLEMSKALDVTISPGQTVTRIEMLDENAP
jgi:hypothetical protein